MTDKMAASVPNLKKSVSDRPSISKSESLNLKKNHFVDEKKNKKNSKKSIEMGFEYDFDVRNDEDFFNKIFSNNCYNPSSENLIDYYLEIRRMIDDASDKDEGNIGAVLGMTVIGLFGFLGFSFTIIGGIAGGVIGGTLGRYAGKKLRRKIKRKGPLTQEQLLITKLQCVVKMGKLQRDYLKHNLNKYRILIEKMMEESSIALDISSFEDTKKITKVLIKFRNFMLGVQPQKAVLLCYKLFKMYLKQVDYQDPVTLQEIAAKINNIMIPYVKLMEVSQSNDEKKKVKKLTKLISYQKIKKLINKPEIQNILKQYPDIRDSQEFITKFREFLKQKVNLEAQMNPELEKNIQEEAQEQFLGRDGVSPNILNQLGPNNDRELDLVVIPDDDDDKILTLDDIHASELDEISPRKSIQQIRNSNAPRSRIFEDNIVGKIKTTSIPSKMFTSEQIAKVKTPASVYIDADGNQMTSKKLSNQVEDDDSSDDSSVSRDLEQISLDDAKKLVDDSALYEGGDESITRNEIKINSRTSISDKKSPPKKVLETSVNLKIDFSLEPRANSRDLEAKSNRSRASSPMKKETMSCDNVEVLFDPKRTVKGPELVKINSYSNVVNEEEEEEQKEEDKQAEEEMIKRHEEKKKSQNNIPNRMASRSATITKENEEKFNNLVQKTNANKTKKELVFEKIIGIAYDKVSKWEKVVASPTITVHKIKPENSPVVLIRAWGFLEGFSVGDVFNQIFNIQERSKWDTVLAECAVLEQLDADTEVFYFCIKTPFGITERDFLQKRQHQRDYPEKGTTMISFQSIEHPIRPPIKNKVRGETHIAGYIIKPSEKDPNSTDLCILTQVDIKGNIPKAIVNMVSGRAPADWFNRLKKACEDFRKRNPGVRL